MLTRDLIAELRRRLRAMRQPSAVRLREVEAAGDNAVRNLDYALIERVYEVQPKRDRTA